MQINGDIVDRFNNQVVVITGAASGIGAATAALFAREGASVVVADIASTVSTVQAIKDAGGAAIGIEADIATSAGAQATVRCAIEHFGRLDILINNAGIGTPAMTEATTEEAWDRYFDVNVKSGFLCTKFALPHLREAERPVVLFTSSIAGLEGVTGLMAYCASKAAVINMARSMALEFAGERIRVNVVCPGATETPMLRGAAIPLDVFANQLPLRRLVQPEEIAQGFAYLASSAAGSITGQVLTIDGGFTAGDFKSGAFSDKA
jgi:NAD(P)-dependent dehydrogenase (short-subunit alcohol dehydrogenase family)